MPLPLEFLILHNSRFQQTENVFKFFLRLTPLNGKQKCLELAFLFCLKFRFIAYENCQGIKFLKKASI